MHHPGSGGGGPRQGQRPRPLSRVSFEHTALFETAETAENSEMGERLVFIGTCSVTTTLVSAFTKSDNRAKVKFSFDLLEPHIGSLLLAFLCLT